MEEEWKVLTEEGLEFYQISNLGNVRIIDRAVPTKIVNHGKEMSVIAHRKGKVLKPQYDGGRPTVRMVKSNGVKCRRSVALMVLQYFSDEVPENIIDYNAGFIDGDVTNVRIDNLLWVPKAALISTVGKLSVGEEKEHFKKYCNVVVYCAGHIVAFFKNTTQAAEELNKMGFSTYESVLTRAIRRDCTWFYIFDIKLVDDETFHKIEMSHSIQNMKIIYDILMADRKAKGRLKKENKIIYKEKIVYKPKIVEKVVYKEVKEKNNEKSKKEKKLLDKTISTNTKGSKKKVHKKIEQNNKLDDKEKIKRDIFKEELLKRLK